MSKMIDRLKDFDSFTLVVFNHKNKMVSGGSYSNLELATKDIPIMAKNAFAYMITAKKDGIEEDVTTRFSTYLRQIDNNPNNV